MHQIFFIGHADDVAELEPDENPADAFTCMSSLQFHRDARAQLYALVTGSFVFDAMDMEILDREISVDGPYLYRLDEGLMGRLSDPSLAVQNSAACALRTIIGRCYT